VRRAVILMVVGFLDLYAVKPDNPRRGAPGDDPAGGRPEEPTGNARAQPALTTCHVPPKLVIPWPLVKPILVSPE
jgi:hypothetical protein